jgi:nucleoside-diphosphate-sugar epimerase
MARYLVAGAAGFIASKVSEFLLAEGHTVIGVDNLNDSYDVRLKEWRLQRLQGRAGFRFYQASICDRSELQAVSMAAQPFDAVFNLAARAGVRQSVEQPWDYIDTNVTGTLNLLDLCRVLQVPKFVLASTASLYGSRNPVPYREDSDTDCPLPPYAASKKSAELLCYAYHSLHSLDIIVCRYFSVYGPAGRPDMSPFRFVQWIAEDRPVILYGDGKQSRDFTYVEDIARGTIAALGLAGFNTINLGSACPIVLINMIRRIECLVGRTARLEHHDRHPADVPSTWADIQRARTLLGWEPRIAWEEGIARLVKWYLDNRKWAREIRTN